MKFLRYGSPNAEKPAVLDDTGGIRSLVGVIEDFEPGIFNSGLPKLGPDEILALPIVEKGGRIGACLADVPNFYCIGLNYYKLEATEDLRGSSDVIITSKSTSALSGPYDDINMSPNLKKLDWEVELGVVIGKPAFRLSKDEVADVIAGYCLVGDYSERSLMFDHGGQWIKGKSLPGFGPVGPYLVTPDEISDPQNLSIWLDVNGVRKQYSNTSNMITSVYDLIYHMSHFMKLIPGDLIATGTPPGIGMHQNPPTFLHGGDVVTFGVDGLGTQRAHILA